MSESTGFSSSWRRLTLSLKDVLLQIGAILQTRLDLAASELKETLDAAKVAAPMAITTLVLGATAYLLVMVALAAVVAGMLKSNPYRWPLAFSIVGGLWLLIGSIAAYFAVREIQIRGFVPQRTLEVLEGDKIWIQNEAKNRI